MTTAIVDDTIEVAVRRARMDAAQGTRDVIAAMAAGAGAELVARQQLSREILETRVRRSRRAAGGCAAAHHHNMENPA